MAVASAQPVGARPGYATTSQCVIMVCSFSNASATLSCNGSDYTITWNTVGSSGAPAPPAQAGYVDHITVTGLSSLTQYSYTVTQGAGSITGQFYTAPGDEDDFCFFYNTCDNEGTTTSLGGDPTGGYDQIRTYCTTGDLPVVGILHHDDLHGYVDLVVVDDSATTTGMATTDPAGAATSSAEFDYALAYLNAYGLCGDATNAAVAWGRDEDRVWCMQNINLWPQWGDHEFKDGIGWTQNVAHANYSGQWASGKAVWDAFMLPMQPPSIDASNAWGMSLGPVKIVAGDSITNGDPAAPRTIYGSTQIGNIKTALTTSEEFKIFSMANSIRYLSATPSGNRSGAQQPIYDNAIAEYQSLFTDSTSSLMQNDRTNGKLGELVTLHGDYHRGLVLKNQNNDGGSDLAESFYSVSVGTINGSYNFPVDDNVGNTNIITGYTFDAGNGGSTVEWIQASGTFGPPGNDWQVLRVEVYGSRYPKEMHLVMSDSSGTEVWSKKFVHNMTLNYGIEVNDTVFDKQCSIVSNE